MYDSDDSLSSTLLPAVIPFASYTDARQAVRRLVEIYDRNTAFIRDGFANYLSQGPSGRRVRAYYPALRIRVSTYQEVDSRLSYGHVVEPGMYVTTVTQPSLYYDYLLEQISLLLRNHGVPVEVGESDMPIPVHFSFVDGKYVEGVYSDSLLGEAMRDHFDVPDLAVTDDAIVNGTWIGKHGEAQPLAPFTAPRIDYSLHRLQHYTATAPEHFQNFVLFTNYQFYVDEFCNWARDTLARGEGGYTALVEPGNRITVPGPSQQPSGMPLSRIPQMPSYHLVREGHGGITLINIGIGPANAKTITDHVAVLRPSAWLMLGHCAGLRTTQRLGDYVLAHGYVRQDHVLDDDLPIWVPVPPLAEIQVALEQAVADVSGLSGWELKRIMRTGTVASTDNRNWELRDNAEPVRQLSQSRAIAMDMESAAIAANGFRFRVPYGTLLCVSDKPLHGELKLPGMASDFYRKQVGQHLQIGIRALELLRDMPRERLHSRKLRSFIETAFK
ncbi:AMP nucleosidase [Allopusillimonas soli]|uniref:AMP nucleosidase n=1 Tax=Allopusillimonas soli TaxID=659016 RepID=A0A853FHF2_9BURK|nr:AMP nucleosidase [Allopusillimonas soli]NYT37871.1 AMP nucleosidase [Allopusillimonas soli]TEA73775.1 AMP nucleosidase [Allopusillimonas soli]